MRQMEQSKTRSGGSPYTLTFPEVAAQTFEKGAPVVLSASGTVQEATSPIGAAAAVVGVAAMPATGVTGSAVTVWIADDDTIFGIPMAAGVQADVKAKVAVTKSGGLWTADRTTAGPFLVEAVKTLPSGQVVAYGRFLDAATQLNLAA